VAKIEFALPDVGEGLEEGEIVSWLVAPGDTVNRDQPLVEVQTDKALVELPSPVAGQVVSLSFAAGDIVKVGQVLVVLEDGQGGDTAPAAPAKAPPVPPPPPPPTSPVAPAPAEAPASATAAPAAAETAGAGPAARPKAAPAVRKLALDRGVELAAVVGTGPGGRILASDVEAAAATPATAAAATSAPTAPAATGVPEFQTAERRSAGSRPDGSGAARVGWMESGRHPLRGIRRVTAEAMARSWSEIPHLTTLDEIDATGLLAARQRLADAGIDITIGALQVAAVARGLRRYPVFNASLEFAAPSGSAPSGSAPSGADPGIAGGSAGAGPDGGTGGAGTIVVHPDCNVGLAVATADGLVVPVIRNADRRTLADLAAEVRRLTAAARERRVDLAELRGGTFTISNWGAIGGRFATPLIRPPEVGIMGFGAIRPRPFVVDGEVKARPTLPWSLSADHRLIDGDVATGFAEYVTGLLADPVALLAELLATGNAGA
jgi:pyruvate dehydrogenase E2 component (dihydrolipoamide acetyltransferase)